jgi:Domain of unknown function (DUF222)
MRLAVFEKALEDFKGELADFDPALITTGAATRAFEVFSAVSRIMVTATTLVAGRAAEGGAWRHAGHRSAADWMAATTGSGVSESIGVLETSEQLVALPETTEALRRGELSGSQLKVIAATAAENPSAERELLDTARHDSLKALKEQSLRVKARAGSEDDARARYEKIRKNRSLHLWTDDDGVGRLDARLPPDDFARLAGAIRLESNAIFGEARKAGRREPGRAYDADALVALVTGTSTTGPSASTGPSTGTGRERDRRVDPEGDHQRRGRRDHGVPCGTGRPRPHPQRPRRPGPHVCGPGLRYGQGPRDRSLPDRFRPRRTDRTVEPVSVVQTSPLLEDSPGLRHHGGTGTVGMERTGIGRKPDPHGLIDPWFHWS